MIYTYQRNQEDAMGGTYQETNRAVRYIRLTVLDQGRHPA